MLNNHINEDVRRQRHIVDKIILGWIILSIIGVGISLIVYVGFIKRSDNQTSPVLLNVGVLAFFIALYYLSKKGLYKPIAILLVSINLLLAGYMSFTWRADAPLALLLYALSIVTSGIILGTKSSFFTTLLSFVIMSVIAHLQSNHIIYYDKYWAIVPTGLKDTITASFALLIIAIVSFLSNYELEKALKRAKKSEFDLKKQNEQLEVLVQERTQKLQQAQTEKLTQLYRFAEFGRGASGLFHDLVNPLNTVSLNLDQLNERSKKFEHKEMKGLINTAINNTKRLENFVITARKQLQNQDELRFFTLKQEITQVIQILNYKVRKAHVRIVFTGENNIKTFNNPIKFSQLMMNLISNAVDAYDDSDKSDKIIAIVLKKNNKGITITIQDWASGINTEHLSKIFDPLFTTKNFEKGTGIGLAICQNIVHKNFKGTIRVKSKIGNGTLFTIKFHVQNPPSGKVKRERKN
jgi:signal transduction histidine kinase